MMSRSVAAGLLLLILAVVAHGGRIVDDDDLQECLDAMAADAMVEGQLEEEHDTLLKTLKEKLVEDDIVQWYRDDNRTKSIQCAVNLTLCNNANDFEYFQPDGPKRAHKPLTERQLEKILAPLREHEEISRAAYARVEELKAIHAPKTQARTRPKKHHDRHKKSPRSVYQCNLEQCLEFRAVSVAFQKSLRRNITGLRESVALTEHSIVAFLRFAELYRQVSSVCSPALRECEAGNRVLRLTVTNGDDKTVTAVFFGFGTAEFTGFSSQAVSALANGDSSQMETEFLASTGNSGGTADSLFDDVPASGSEHLKVTLASPSTRGVLSMLAVFEDETTVAGSMEIFNEEAEFILDASSSNAKRYDWPDNSCGATGYPIDIAPAHVKTADFDFINLHVQELPITFPYPVGIPSVVLPNHNPGEPQ